MEKYVKIDESLFINKKIPYYKLPLLLVIKFKPFFLGTRMYQFKRVLLIVVKHLLNSSDTISLSVEGDIVLKVSDQNYKVFDLKNECVHTLYSESYAQRVESNMKLRAQNKLNTEIIKWDKQNKVIIEKFLNGYHPKRNISERINSQEITLLKNLINQSKVKECQYHSYVGSLYHKNINLLAELKTKFSSKNYEKLSIFIENSYEKLTESNYNNSIPLVLSHGDLKNKNVIEVENQLIPIDWEYCDFRSPYFDSFFYVLFLKNYKKNVSNLFLETLETLREHSEHKNVKHYLNSDLSILLRTVSLEYVYLRLTQLNSREFIEDIDKYFISVITLVEDTIEDAMKNK